MFAAYALTGFAIVAANRSHPGFRNGLRAPQKAGISLMPPLGVYSWVSSTEMDNRRFRYQRYGAAPAPEPRGRSLVMAFLKVYKLLDGDGLCGDFADCFFACQACCRRSPRGSHTGARSRGYTPTLEITSYSLCKNGALLHLFFCTHRGRLAAACSLSLTAPASLLLLDVILDIRVLFIILVIVGVGVGLGFCCGLLVAALARALALRLVQTQLRAAARNETVRPSLAHWRRHGVCGAELHGATDLSPKWPLMPFLSAMKVPTIGWSWSHALFEHSLPPPNDGQPSLRCRVRSNSWVQKVAYRRPEEHCGVVHGDVLRDLLLARLHGVLHRQHEALVEEALRRKNTFLV